MTGYIKTTIDFNKIENTVSAAKSADLAGQTHWAKELLKSLASTITEEIGDSE